jgi:hypothetical protein
MFRLGRPNVLPDLDLGVQKGMQHAYRLPKLPTPKDVLRIGERWAPYASVASWYMWRLLELPDVIRKEAQARSAARTKHGASSPARPSRPKTASSSKRPATGKRTAATKATASARKRTRGAAKKTAVRRPAGATRGKRTRG